MRYFTFKIFMRVSRMLSGIGLGIWFPRLTRKVYGFLFRLFKPSGDIILVDVQGLKMYADLRGTGMGPGSIHGKYEKGETKLFKKIVKTGMSVVDIGANIGYYTLIASKLVGENGKVFAFEPGPENYKLLVNNIKINNFENIVPIQKAVSDKTGVVNLFLNPSSVGDHRIYDPKIKEGWQSIQVDTITLDDYFNSIDSQVDVLKMDIEGAEIVAIQGMLTLLSKNHNLKILTEFWPQAIRAFGYSPENYLHQFIVLGFNLYIVNDNSGKITLSTISNIMNKCEGDRLITLYVSSY